MPSRNNCTFGLRTVVTAISILALTAVAAADPNAPPTITQNPASQTVCAGVDVTFTVVATGENLTYQWRVDDTDITGETSSTLQLLGVAPLDNGNYDVIVSNPNGDATSSAAVLIVDDGPQIIEQPLTQEVCEGTGVTLSVALSNQSTSFQDVVGSTGSSGSGARMRGNYYRVDTATTLTRIEQYLKITTSGLLVFFVYEANAYSGPYSLVLEDSVSYSGTGEKYYSSSALAFALDPAKYYIIGAAWPGSHTYYWNYAHPDATAFGASLAGFAYNWVDPLPASPPANTNGSAYMQRLTTSDLAITYQWRKNDEDIPGAGGPSYTLQSMSSDDVADYNVVVDNACGTVVSDAASLTLGLGVTITHDPNDHVGCAGGGVLFLVTASGPDLTYQWRKNGQDITGATYPYLPLSPLSVADTGLYDVVVANACDSATSSTATLTVAGAVPTITTQPVGVDGCAGQPVSLSVQADGGDLQYQWRRDDVEISGAIGDTYALSSPTLADAGDYDVVVSNGCGAVPSDIATLAFEEAIVITQQPVGDLVCGGEDHTFTVVATGSSPTYQWRKDGEDILDATSDTYAIVGALVADSGAYDVVVTNGCASVASAVAVLTAADGAVITEQPIGGRFPIGQSVDLTVEIDPASFPVDLDIIGAADSSSTGPRVRGNSYDVTDTVTLTRIAQYLDIVTAGPIVFFVYEATAGEQGPYTLILQSTVANPTTGPGFHASNPLDLQLEAGHWYLIGAAWSGNHVYYWGGAHPQAAAFGQTVHGYAASYTGTLPYQPVPTSPNVWRQRITTTHPDVEYQWRKNGGVIAGAVEATYSIPAISPQHSGIYDVVVTNVCGSITSETATLLVTASPTPTESSPSNAPASDKGPNPYEANVNRKDLEPHPPP